MIQPPAPVPSANEFELARAWNDPASWRLGVLYMAPSDPRWLVPMRFTNAAWTPNIAHSRATILAASLLAIAAGPFVAAAIMGRVGNNLLSAALIGWFLMLFVPVGVYVRYAGASPNEE